MMPAPTPSAVRHTAVPAGGLPNVPPEPRLRAQLLDVRNTDGGWAYRRGNRSRIEPTCWALLALESKGAELRVLEAWPRRGSWLIDAPEAPENYAFNALAALTLLEREGMTSAVDALARNVIGARGKVLANSPNVKQNNSIQAWSWVSDTASWVEPTAWSLLLLKKVRRHQRLEGMEERIASGEAHACRPRMPPGRLELRQHERARCGSLALRPDDRPGTPGDAGSPRPSCRAA